MNCETLRERLNADPLRNDEEFDRHAESCAACEAYRSRLLRAEALIQKALRVDVNAVGKAASTREALRARRPVWPYLGAGIAAGVAVLVTFAFFQSGGVDLSEQALAAAVVDHWHNEPESWVATSDEVAGTLLSAVLGGAAEINLAELATVSYAESCLVAGELIPHLVVQGEQGPYMVLLMPRRRLESPIPLQLPDEGLAGHILPAGNGSIAVLGGGLSAELEQIEASIVSAVNWTI